MHLSDGSPRSARSWRGSTYDYSRQWKASSRWCIPKLCSCSGAARVATVTKPATGTCSSFWLTMRHQASPDHPRCVGRQHRRGCRSAPWPAAVACSRRSAAIRTALVTMLRATGSYSTGGRYERRRGMGRQRRHRPGCSPAVPRRSTECRRGSLSLPASGREAHKGRIGHSRQSSARQWGVVLTVRVCRGIDESRVGTVRAPSSWRGLATPSTSVQPVAGRRHGWPGQARP